MLLKQRYGPWALLVGGSEGVGEHLARQLGAAGINVILVARKPEPLAETARKVRAESGVEVRTLQLDLMRPDILERLREVTEDVEIGLLVHNVAGNQAYGPFVDTTLEAALSAVLTSPVALTKLAHHYAIPMARRGRGGVLFTGSLAGNAGSYSLTTYAAAKAFTQIFGEGLWAELQPRGVDVLVFPLGATDTPSRARYGTGDSDEMPVASSEEVARQALAQLPNGPVYVAPENRPFFELMCTPDRRRVVEIQRDLQVSMLPDGV
ncbi:SDR family NAD(P)-dependent oxidoreductase [Novosphingobium sp. H3SJ31-1]|uniref:SDR family NAD(P)-dependent oxidoreductase n=2 Tax=Novosphingobium album (ex Liu et al. 2023) TaxID=3031130 RepID=A0ABT5WTF0_9SPHN|nr:SDR family NAD(P)-dependent oxidoreductase [Novosphingobium album (ex Liu et al. 2023)]